MNHQDKKTYTWEDNVKAMMFGLKDLLKEVREIKELLSQNKKTPDEDNFFS